MAKLSPQFRKILISIFLLNEKCHTILKISEFISNLLVLLIYNDYVLCNKEETE